MSETISMTDILLTVSVGCNLWFLFLLLYERIMDTQTCPLPQKHSRTVAVVGRHCGKRIAAHEEVPRKPRTSSARAVSGWHRPGQPLPYRRKKPPLSKKALSCRRKRLLLTTEKRKRVPSRTSPGGKTRRNLHEHHRLRNWSSGRTSRRKRRPDAPRASGSSFRRD